MAVKIRIDGDTHDFEQKVKALDDTASKALNGVKVAAVAAATALVAVGTYAFKVGMDFEAAMSGVEAVLQGTQQEMSLLSTLARDMGATTVYSATQAAEALQFIAQAGYDAVGAAELLPSVLNLAATDAMDLGVAAQYVTNGLAIFGEAAGGAAHYADLLAVTAAAADGGVSEMADAMAIAGGRATLAGMAVEELAVAVGILANNGLKGAEGGTALRGVLKNLYPTTGDAAAAMKELGIETANADGTIVKVQDVLEQLQAKLAGLDDVSRQNFMGRIFDERTIAAGAVLIRDAGDSWDSMAVSIGNAEGAAALMAEIQLDNLAGDINLLKSAAESFGIQMYEAFGDSARSAVQSLTAVVGQLMTTFSRPDVAGAISAIGDALASLIVTAGNIAAAVLPALAKILGLVASNANILLPVVLLLVAAFKAFSITGTVTAGLKALATANAVTTAAMTMGTTATTANAGAQAALTAALATSSMAQAVTTAAQAAGMSITAAGTLVTSTGTAATAADTLAVLLNSGAISAKSVIVGVLTGKIGFATAAQALWNAAMIANPIGIMVMAIVALIAALAILSIALGDHNSELAEMQTNTKNAIAASKGLRSSIAESAAEYENSTAAMQMEAAGASALANQIFELQASYDGSAVAAEKMRIMVEQLNAAVPGLTLEFDAQTGALNMTQDAVNALIASQKEMMIAQAQAARAQELVASLVEQKAQMHALQAEYAAWELKLERGEISQKTFAQGTFKLKKEMTALEGSIAQTDAQIDEYIGASIEAGASTEEAADTATEYEAKLAELAAQYGATEDAIRAATDGTVESLEEWEIAQIALQKSADDLAVSMQGRYEELAEVSQDAFGRIKQEQALSVKQMIANLTKNTEATNKWADNLSELRGRTASGELAVLGPLIDQLAEGGPKYANQLEKIATATDAELAALAAAYATGGEAAKNAMLAEFGLLADSNAGSDAVDGIAEGIESNDALSTAGEAAINAAVGAITTTISGADMPGIGKNMMGGIASGIEAGKSAVVNAAAAAVTAAIAAAKAAGEIESPSKKMRREVGRQLPAGAVAGIKDGTPEMVVAARDQMDAVLDAYGDTEMPTLEAQFLAAFDDVPVDFFALGKDAGEQFSKGFSLATLGFSSMLENILLGTPPLSVASGAPSSGQLRDVNINFYEPVESPDATARAIRKVFEHGLAGERN